jgi:radical SAM protein with 4Fe4S-binding SPASM domain
VTLQVTDKCNYQCVHCYQQHIAEDELRFDEIERILKEIAEIGVLFLTLMGGEFFMRRDADRILTRAHELGFAIKLFSTGHHIHERRADFLATLRPIQVDMSIYAANAHLHEQVTDHVGSWNRTVAAARRLVARGVRVRFKTPLMQSNAKQVAELRALAAEVGTDSLFDANITAMETADAGPTGLRMDADTLHQLYTDESGLAEYVRSTFGNRHESDVRPLDRAPCGAGQRTCAVNPRGKVKACMLLPMEMGDLRRQSFSEVWYGSAELARIRSQRWADIRECNVCPVRNYCHRCSAMALLEDGDIRGPSLEACRQTVALRDALREMGVIPAHDTALPPTWSRVNLDGRHGEHGREGDCGKVRSPRLRVLP